MTTSRPPANAATALASTVVDELVRGGVENLVLAPGSRSAALGFAAFELAAAGRLALHTRIDERSAGFLALGLAKTSRRPVAVVTTSGTAVANLHPAVLEASHAGVPLLLLTADRPARLRGTGANQTTEQAGIFAGAVRLAVDVPAGHPGGDEHRQVRGWRSLTARALAVSRGATGSAPGPVHLNLQLEPPLTPDARDGWTTPVDGREHEAAWTTTPRPSAPEPETLEAGPRTVVVAGDDAGPPARVLAERGGWPLLAEPTSGSRTGENAIRTYRLLLEDPELAGRIERIVVCGHPTLSRPVTQLLSRDDVEILAVPGRTGWTDPGHAASRVLSAATAEQPADDGWLDEWRARDADVGKRLDALLADRGELTPHLVAGAVAAVLPPNGLLFVGASNPVRDLDLMVPRYEVGARRMVIGNRGLAGIDGSASTAIGATLGRPHTTRAFALLGDVTFLHDSNGLVLGPDEARRDLSIVVVDDDGGSVFASLEQGAPEHRAAYERLFGTPHGTDLAALCAATGTPYRRVTTLPELREALDEPAGGIEVIDAVVRRDDRRELDAAIRGLVR
ncbi:MAG TPA: 2-succinyl-5-enolpyruvyl-6-hydroxy-3-cyclohexene-1-carboxylic-acid synthase [Nocardioidaceae bacterium]|nr:2-succinyl-5-enolpyruvyl-6-hydroxy-3-cyclohexene-1-carboxylic-acid synthase [Nocardioidaceae bacterium]